MGWWEAGFNLSAAKVSSTRLLGLSQRRWAGCYCANAPLHGDYSCNRSSQTKKHQQGRNRRSERSVQLSMRNYQELFLEEGVSNGNFPLAWPEACFCSHCCNWEWLCQLWCLSQAFRFCDPQKLSDPLNAGKSKRWCDHSLQLSLHRKTFNHKETLNAGRAGKSDWQMKLYVKILPVPLE